MTAPERKPLLAPQSPIPPIPSAPWTRSLPSPADPARRIPQAIAHRGYKALHPENTMRAFRAAVEAGTHALETDLHLSADETVVLSHDKGLKRCYGVDRPVAACDWEYLSTLRTLRAPHEPLPRLRDLLEWLAEPDAKRAKIWVFLDVKVDDDPERLLGAVANVLDKVKRSDGVPWNQRIVVGCWNQRFLHASLAILPTYAAAHTSHSPLNSARFLRSPAYPGLSFNMLQQTLVGPLGARFIRAVRSAPDAEHRSLFVWTVNKPEWMEWAVKRRVDGVITDDPAAYLDVVGKLEQAAAASAADKNVTAGKLEMEPDSEGKDPLTESNPEVLGVADPTSASPGSRAGWARWGRLYLEVAAVQFLIALFSPLLRRSTRWEYLEPRPPRPPRV